MIRLITTLCLVVLCLTWNFEAIAQIVPPKTQENMTRDELKKVVKEAIKNLGTKTPTQEAEDFYQFETNDKPCTHCPQYLKLIREVNQIVEKMPSAPSDSISTQNESLIQLNRLKFMYYEKKISEENGGGEKCIQYQHSDFLNPTLVTDENSALLAEEALSLPNIISLQLIPAGNEREIRYFYRGEGVHRNVIVEVVIYPDRRAVLRYRKLHQQKGQELPDLGALAAHQKPRIEVPKVIVDIGSAISGDKKKEKVIEAVVNQEVDIAEKSGSVTFGEGIKFNSDNKAKLNQQSMSASLNNGSGDLVKIDVQHSTLKGVGVTTVVPIAFKLDEDGLAVGGAISYDAKKEFSGNRERTGAVVVRLTDHNHEYIKTSFVSKIEGNEVVLSSRYSLGKMGSVTGTALSNSNGRKEVSMGHAITDSAFSMTTRVGMSSDAKRFFELQREQKIGKTQSMVLTIRLDEKKDTTIMYQYRVDMK